MTTNTDFLLALEAFLNSQEFEDVVHDDRAQLPVVPRVVELHRNGTYTVYSKREDAVFTPDTVVVEIPPLGTPDEVRARMRRAMGF
jgi:hypothetical protein